MNFSMSRLRLFEYSFCRHKDTQCKIFEKRDFIVRPDWFLEIKQKYKQILFSSVKHQNCIRVSNLKFLHERFYCDSSLRLRWTWDHLVFWISKDFVIDNSKCCSVSLSITTFLVVVEELHFSPTPQLPEWSLFKNFCFGRFTLDS